MHDIVKNTRNTRPMRVTLSSPESTTKNRVYRSFRRPAALLQLADESIVVCTYYHVSTASKTDSSHYSSSALQ